jgi:hypothetical protein
VAQSTNKKVLLARFDRGPVEGFVQSANGFEGSTVEVLTPSGNLLMVPVQDTKAVCFVRDFGETWPPAQTTFLARPKTPGIWVRLRFRDGDSIEGILANNLMLLDPAGFSIVPPDPTQRIYIPKEALTEVQVLGVIGTSMRKRPGKKTPEDQLGLFGEG